MTRHLFLSAAAVAVIGLGVQGCSKKDQAATSNAADSTASATSNAAGNAADATGNAVGSAEGAGPVSDVQDATAAGVGLASAALPKTPQDFVTAAAISDMYEIRASKLAETKADSPAIKAFAKQMIADHTKTTTELKALASKANLKLPAMMDQRRQGMFDNLGTSKDGHEFDKRYVNQQVNAHREAVDLMKGYGEHGNDAGLKAFAAKAAPTIQGHLDMAKKLDAAPNNAGPPGAADPAGGKG